MCFQKYFKFQINSLDLRSNYYYVSFSWVIRNHVEWSSLAPCQFSVANYFLPRPTPYRSQTSDLHSWWWLEISSWQQQRVLQKLQYVWYGSCVQSRISKLWCLQDINFPPGQCREQSSEVTLSLTVKAITNKMNELWSKPEENRENQNY